MSQWPLLGANGSGKTTLLKAFNREIYPASKPNSWLKIYGKENWNVMATKVDDWLCFR